MKRSNNMTSFIIVSGILIVLVFSLVFAINRNGLALQNAAASVDHLFYVITVDVELTASVQRIIRFASRQAIEGIVIDVAVAKGNLQRKDLGGFLGLIGIAVHCGKEDRLIKLTEIIGIHGNTGGALYLQFLTFAGKGEFHVDAFILQFNG